MAFKEVHVTVSRNVVLRRSCELCGFHYNYHRRVSASGKSGWGKDSGRLQSQAHEDARGKLKGKKPAVHTDLDGVVCPNCMRFSENAVRAHFSAGIRRGVQEILRKPARSHAIWSGIFLVLFAILVWLLYWIWNHEDRLSAFLGLVFFGLLALAVGVLSLIGLIHARGATRNLRRLSAVDDKRLSLIAANACLDNDNSLAQDWRRAAEAREGGLYAHSLVSHLSDFFNSARPEKNRVRKKKAAYQIRRCSDCGARIQVPIAKANLPVRCRNCLNG